MGDTVLKTLTHLDGKRRVVIVQRDNGLFGFEEEHLVRVYDEQTYPDWDEMVWSPPPHRVSFGIFDSPATAEREARDRIAWLRTI
jgi:hypothetical protein